MGWQEKEKEELLLQFAWARRCFGNHFAFPRYWGTIQPEDKIVAIHPGKWNRLGGPDFQQARLHFRGSILTGDIELHWSREDYFAHGHHEDRAYDNVILHAYYFPVTTLKNPLLIEDSHKLPPLEVALAPAMQTSWEEIDIQFHQSSLEPFPPVREAPLANANKRWKGKREWAARHIEAEGWFQACHLVFLDALARPPSRQIIRDWGKTHPWPEVLKGDPKNMPNLPWLSGIRPNGQPQKRLSQYLQWSKNHPQWPEQLPQQLENLWPGKASTWSRHWEDYLKQAGWGIAVSRDLLINAALPLVAALNPRISGRLRLAWMKLPPGNFPEDISGQLRRAGLPLDNGHHQALLPSKNNLIRG